MSKRLLALLLTAPHMRRSRAALQMLLWGDEKSDPAANLRQLLRQTRLRLGIHAHCLWADGATIALLHTQNATSQTASDNRDFFDDAGVGTEDFEDWFRVERANFEAAQTSSVPGQNIVPTLMSNLPLRHARAQKPKVFLTNAGLSSLGHRAGIVNDWVSNHLRDVLVWNAFVEFHDMRDVQGDGSQDLEVRVSVLELGDQIEASIGVFRFGKCLLSQSRNYASGNALGGERHSVLEFAHRVGSLIERLVSKVLATDIAQQKTPFLYDTVCQLFTLRTESVVSATEDLVELTAQDPSPQNLAWQAFGLMLQNGERLIQDGRSATDAAGALLRDAYERDPVDLSVLSVYAHYQAFVERDNGFARDLNERAFDIAPFSHFSLDVRAMLELYDGNLKSAVFYGDQALRLGRFSAMAGYVAGTEVMLATLSGDHHRAASAGRTLLREHPNFLPVLRHVLPSLLEIGEFEEASVLMERIRKLDPVYATSGMEREAYALPSEISRDVIMRILKKHGEF
ncbi:MAG: hypothetical protein AAGD04_10520 [Pseudomonadota bacterium]